VIWTTWRQHRGEALAGLGVLAVVTGLTVATNAYRGFSLGPSGPAPVGPWLLLTLGSLPCLVGVFVGAPLLARDLEHHTHRLVWTQGTPRGRWLGVKLALVFGVVLVAAAGIGALVSAFLWLPNQPVTPRWIWFDMQGPAFVAYTAFAFWFGVAAGAVIGRSYPAMALTLVVYIAARVLVEVLLRPHYLEALSAPATFTNNGGVTTGADLSQAWVIVFDVHRGLVVYQPLERFWLFQSIETALFLGLAALLVAVAVHWTTRRVR